MRNFPIYFPPEVVYLLAANSAIFPGAPPKWFGRHLCCHRRNPQKGNFLETNPLL
jgi:hypothetical protein